MAGDFSFGLVTFDSAPQSVNHLQTYGCGHVK
jgi:hypothetical protein